MVLTRGLGVFELDTWDGGKSWVPVQKVVKEVTAAGVVFVYDDARILFTPEVSVFVDHIAALGEAGRRSAQAKEMGDGA